MQFIVYGQLIIEYPAVVALSIVESKTGSCLACLWLLLVLDSQPEADTFLTVCFSLFLSFTAAMIASEGVTFRKLVDDPVEVDYD